VHYLLTDRVSSPPDSAAHFSESLALAPLTFSFTSAPAMYPNVSASGPGRPRRPRGAGGVLCEEERARMGLGRAGKGGGDGEGAGAGAGTEGGPSRRSGGTGARRGVEQVEGVEGVVLADFNKVRRRAGGAAIVGPGRPRRRPVRTIVLWGRAFALRGCVEVLCVVCGGA
jgi:hypothetical protein